MAKKSIKSVNLLPEFLRTDKNSKFLSGTLDQLIQPPNLERIDGYIGSKLTSTYDSAIDVYISENSTLRRDFQLEPSLVIRDENGKVNQVKAIDDLANEISVEGSFNNDFDRLFRPDFYSFNPHIDFDKFVNYQKYYWLSTGPNTISITGKQLNSTSTYTVTDNEIKSAWVFSPDGLTEDPLIVLYRGNTYNFSVNSRYKFYIKTAPSLGLDDVYNVNVIGNGTSNGTVKLTVTENTPSTLYYTSDDVNFVQGKIVIKQSTEDAFIDVESEILGKKNYTSGTGIALSNGMKIRFEGEVIPETYKNKEFFVEGVGLSIRLIDFSLLTGSEKLAAQFDDDFDVYGFDEYPFDSFQQLPLVPEYITINRASQDLNPWSRYNRWVHEDIIKISAEVNGAVPVYPSDMRARRPIIEFAADLQLYNFGNRGIRNIDLIDNETLDAFSTIEGSAGYHVDGTLLQQGHRVVFNADTDPSVRGKIYEINFRILDGVLKLELKPAEDHTPAFGSSLSTILGTTSAGKSWWFNGDKWIYAQQHETLNQSPLFDLFDNDGLSYSSSYKTDFSGSKIFGYELGTGNADPVLGFPITYKNATGIGSFKFKNYFSTDIISIFENNQVRKLPTSISYLKINDQTQDRYVNVWTKAEIYEIPILQLFSADKATSEIEINSIDNPISATFTLEVYKNNNKLPQSDWYLYKSPTRVYVRFIEEISAGTNILLKIFTKSAVNKNGQYEPPINLTNNPLNGPIETATLTEISDHLKSMADRSPEFNGQVFGNNNLRDIPDIAKYGSRLISNINPLSFSSFFLGIKEHDVISAIQKSADQYNQFKLYLFKRISELNDQNNPIEDLDRVLTLINSDKDLNSPWYYSDMLAYGTDKNVRTWEITDIRNTVYPISSDFDPRQLSLRSVLVYINDRQLILNKDYKFLINDSSVELLTNINVGDELRIEDYFSTEGNYVPPTPTKLGLYPKFQPSIYIDTTYVTPTKVIQGHDGSITVAFNDFRDDIILEFEKRIFNNIKSQYRSELFDINNILPGAFRSTEYSLDEINSILQVDFLRWAGFYNVDYLTNQTFDLDNSFTWNYRGGLNSQTSTPVSGYWRNFFKYFYDTDRPNTHPWEMLGFSEQPDWWENEYGPAPYTSGNTILWSDLEKGEIKEGDRAGLDTRYARPGLMNMIPVDEFGNIVDPSQNLISNLTPYNIRQNWTFGDQGPAETAWRRSSFWPFAVQRLLALTAPASYMSLMFDVSRISKNIAGQWVYGDQKTFLDIKNLVLPVDRNSLTSGYSMFVSEIGKQRTSDYLEQLQKDLSNINFNLFYKVGGFISKDKLQIIIDAIEPNSTSPGSILPQENYQLILNISNPIRSSSISGIIVQKSNGKFVIRGYDKTNPYFKILRPTRNSNTPTITVGGISESYLDWTPSETSGETGLDNSDTTTASSAISGHFYQQGQIVRYRQKFYRVKASHRAGTSFNVSLFQEIPSLPIIGGATVQIANGYEKEEEKISYGSEFDRIQDLYDVIIGYGKWLNSQGFIFDEYNQELNELIDWNLSAKEFLYWTTQNWAENSVITLSPFAEKVKFSLSNSVVDNIFDNFYEYSVLKADGLPFPEKKINVNRLNGICTVETIDTTEGIYFIELNSVQKEHAMVFDNTTVFNDVIYDVETGYRQRRMKLIGFRTSEWDGDYFSPGFVYDRAIVSDWKKYVSYVSGDTVRYGGNYYSAKSNVSGSSEFNFNDWVLLSEKPTPDLIPNFEYKINQFEDFYSLDIDNFDSAQQKMAQHLIGYTPRVYLNNIFTNPISQYKFYQGFIKEKGTRNAVKKLAKASIFNLQGETDFTEEWAFRIGQYGSFTSYQEIEASLKEGSFVENPQIINFVDRKPVNPTDLIYYNTSTDLLIKPEDYSPSNTFASTTINNFKLPIAGYVSFEDITATAYNENSLLDIANNNQLNNGDTIWLGFKSNGDWDVLRYELTTAKIIGVFVSAPAEDITFVTDKFHRLSVGDIVSVTRFNDQVNGVYLVKSVPQLNQFSVSSSLVSITNEELLSPGLLYKFNSVRSKSFENLPEDFQMLRAPYGSKFWVDNETNNGDYNWKVYQKIDNFSTKKIRSGYSVPDQELGFSINKKFDSNIVLVGSPGYNTPLDFGRVFVYEKTGETSSRLFSYTLNNAINQYHSSSERTEFGSSVLYSSVKFAGTDHGLLYAGAPAASNLKEKLSGFIRYADATGVFNTSTQKGAVKISSIDPATLVENTELVLLSPVDDDYQRFGHSLTVGGNENILVVGAPGTRTTGTGAIHYYVTLAPVASHTIVNTSTAGTNKIFVNSTASVEVGQTVWIPGYLNDIQNGVKVQTIYDDGLVSYVELDQTLAFDIPLSTTSTNIIKFYISSNIVNTATVVTTSTNGILVAFGGTIPALNSVVGDEYGYTVKSSRDGLTIVVSAPGRNYFEIFELGVGRTIYNCPFENVSTGSRFSQSIAISDNAEYVFAGAPYYKNSDDSFGRVAVYQKINNVFTYTGFISNPVPGASMNFGQAIDIDETTSTLVISAIGLNKYVPVEFDENSTTFDSSSTIFFDTIENFGTVYVYNKPQGTNRFVLVEELTPDIEVGADLKGSNFGFSLVIDNDVVYAGAPAIDAITTSSFYQFTKIDSNKSSLDFYKNSDQLVDIDTIQKIRLIDTFNETIVDYLDIIDPVKGKIAGIAEQELKYKSAYDPAVYSIGTAGVVVDADTSWVDEHIGELWWDLSTVKYVWYEQGNLNYRKNNWGSIFPGATIDVYEWVRSSYLPSEWSSLADTASGLTEGISGQPKYVDNSSISIKQIYDPVSNSFRNVYYYWVKNKVLVPSVKNRRISAYQVSRIIADPTTYGLRYAALLSKDSIALANISSLLVDNRINLNVSYDEIKNKIPRHTEWTLLEESSENSMPPALYEKKLFDSLLGRDSLGNLVPDPSLSERMKYGIEIRPRQTMFKDRRAALRELIEFANSILIENQITGSYSFQNLNAQESPPDEFSREYDQVVEDNEGLLLIDTRLLEQAELSCTVDNGKIRSVNILKSGYGYKIAPSVMISNGGINGEIKTQIDNLGRVIGAEIVNSGSGYATPPNLIVRPFSVIVLVDNLYNGKWTKFEWNKLTETWERKRTQKYNTTLYWKYVDWKAASYNEFIDFTYTVDQVYKLDSIEDIIPGQYVKVKNVGDGRYVILEKTEEENYGTFGKGYDIVYSENGTVQFLDTIWNLSNSNLGFDQNNTYDQTLYDQTPDLELFYILSALKNDIFINELKLNWNLFFFRAVKFALTEQKLLDWAFKTSFINVTNYAGQLDQRPVYKLQTSKNYEDYIKEVKPYHTQIRTFTANHEILEPSNSFITDFDLPSYYNDNSNSYETVDDNNSLLNSYPWKAWNDNYLYSVGNIVVGNGGSGYIYPPQVTLETVPGDSGSGATARAYISSGQVIRIEVINPGSGYKLAPKVILSGGNDSTFVPAIAYAQLFNGKVRVNSIGMKFDRISKTVITNPREITDSFVCNGSQNEFILNWFADPDKTKITVTLDEDLVLSSSYRIENYKSNYLNYNKNFTKIVFLDFVPSYGQLLKINYLKNIQLFDAAERIVEYYSPKSGMPGKELPQLMTGVEYPGVSVQGLPFDYTTDWDIVYSPFGKSSYADGVSYYKSLKVANTASAGTNSVVLSTTTGILVGQLANIISTLTNGFNKIEVHVTGINSITNTVSFDANFVDQLDVGEIIEFWNYDSNTSILDTSIEGGTWDTSTNVLSGALGINPEEIIIDGDRFYTENTGYGPEELVSGTAFDSVAINVYTRFNEGAPTVYNGTIDIFQGTITTASLSFIPPSIASIFVTFDNRIFSYSSETDFLSEIDSDKFNYDWSSNTITIGPQTHQGKLGYTVVGVGGGQSFGEPGVLDRGIVTVDDATTEAEVISMSSTGTVKNAFVTVNGVPIPKLTSVNTSTLGYILTASEITPKRAAVRVYNISTSTVSTVQAWFFGSENQYFNEFREQIFESHALIDELTIDYPPGISEPAAGNIIVEADTGNGFRRLQPPFISYYVVDSSVLTYKIDTNISRGTDFTKSGVRAYLNGVELISDADYYFDAALQQIVVRSGILSNGDSLTVLGVPDGGTVKSEFDIRGNTLKLIPSITSATIRVVTFSNHDDMKVRTESFVGNLNRRYKISRSVFDNNFIWVSVNGIPLVNKIDYTVLEDSRTIELSDKWNTQSTDKVVITSISSDRLVDTVLGYRIFNDIFNRTHYKRLSKFNTTVLTEPLSFTDTEIHVEDSSVLMPPLISKKIPGVVIINGERIEYWVIDGNVLKQLRRATLGTGPSDWLPAGTKVVDQSPEQSVPYSDRYSRQIIYTTASINTYVINTSSTIVYSTSTNINTQTSDGIIFSNSIQPEHQVSVIYGGKLLRKSGIFVQDQSISYDSPDIDLRNMNFTATIELLPSTDIMGLSFVVTATNQVWVYENSNEQSSFNGYVYKGLNYYPPEFTINTLTNKIILNIENIEDNIRLLIIKKEFSKSDIWNDQLSASTTKSLLESTTKQARFLQDKLSELPDKYYYGDNPALTLNSGLALTDENNDPLRGI